MAITGNSFDRIVSNQNNENPNQLSLFEGL